MFHEEVCIFSSTFHIWLTYANKFTLVTKILNKYWVTEYNKKAKKNFYWCFLEDMKSTLNTFYKMTYLIFKYISTDFEFMYTIIRAELNIFLSGRQNKHIKYE